MGVFASSGQARTFDFMAGDVGYVPVAMGHYIENTGNKPLRQAEVAGRAGLAGVRRHRTKVATPRRRHAAQVTITEV